MRTASPCVCLGIALLVHSGDASYGHRGHATAKYLDSPWQPAWREVEQVSGIRGVDSEHRVSTFRSAPIKLDVGRVILTPPKQTPLLMPPEPFVLTSLKVQVVRASDGQPVPLTEVYNHHVVFYADGGKLGADICGGAHLDMLDGLWGVGAEARGTLTEFPGGYGLPGKGPWFANIHLIRSEGVPEVKRCIECTCDTGGGSEDCCRHMSICPGFPEKSFRNSSDVKEYALEYTVGWSPVVDKYQELRYMTLDATGCQLEFQVPAKCPWMWNHDTLHGPVKGSVGLRGSGRELPSDFAVAVRPPAPGCTATVSWDYALPPGAVGRVVFSKAHMHVGGLTVSAYVLRGQNSSSSVVAAGDVTSFGQPELLCSCKARYGAKEPGSKDFVGNELGYVVSVSGCSFDDVHEQPILRSGDRIRVEATYRTDLWFNGVMGLLDLAILPAGDDLLV